MTEPTAGPAGGRRTGSGATGWEALIPLDWNRLRDLTNEPVPHHLKRWWFCLGGTPAYLLLIQITTGILLTFYYQPSTEQAYESVGRITYQVPFGWFVRSIHKWSANLMIVALILHMLRVYFTGAYRHPRQLNWVFGVALLGVTLALGFTGYSLIYEQLSFWGATVAANLTESVPLVGPPMATFLRGGPQVGPTTLTRLYVLHIGVLPAVLIAVLGLHITMVRLHGVTEFEFESPLVREGRGDGATWFLAMVALAGAVVAAVAATGWQGFEFIGYALTQRASQVVWGMIALLLLYAACALSRRSLTGLLLLLAGCGLALGKVMRDLALRESPAPALWVVAGIALLVVLVVALVRQRRFDEPPAPDEPKQFNFFPDHMLTELMIGTGLLLLLTLLTLVFPAGLGVKADPNVTPEHIKPEWYFYFQFRLLKLCPGLFGLTALQVSVLLTGVLMVVVVLWPWIDGVLERVAPGKDLSVYVGITGFLWFLGFTVWEAMVE
ncbi:MAG TPA: cytochrome b N-terminal domain-containing protein [Phycisphaerae bacterium]|nr:cytochrome b N-terminal domain-containing protein [Phycisphaerae bacterium]